MVVVSIPVLTFLRPRLPISGSHRSRPISTAFLRSPLFWTFQAFNIIQGMGYFLPSNYLPSYVEARGLTSTFGSLSLLMLNVAGSFGCILVGALVDRFDVTHILFGVSILAGLSILTLWGLSTSIAPLVIFCLAYGFTGGAYSSAWGGVVKDIQKNDAGVDTSLLFGLLAAGRGVGAVISGPLSEALLSHDHVFHMVKSAYESEYGVIVIFSGCTVLAGGLSWIVRRTGFV